MVVWGSWLFTNFICAEWWLGAVCCTQRIEAPPPPPVVLCSMESSDGSKGNSGGISDQAPQSRTCLYNSVRMFSAVEQSDFVSAYL